MYRHRGGARLGYRVGWRPARPGGIDVNGTVSGLRDGPPRVTARTGAAAYQPLVRTLTLTAPPGMSFATGRYNRAKGVSVTGARGVSTAVSRQRLTVTPHQPLSAATLVVEAPALRETARLRGVYRQASRRHPVRQTFTLRDRHDRPHNHARDTRRSPLTRDAASGPDTTTGPRHQNKRGMGYPARLDINQCEVSREPPEVGGSRVPLCDTG